MYTVIFPTGDQAYNIIPLLKKENINLFPCPWGYKNYADTYFQSSWEDMALEVTVSSVKSTDVTYKTRSGWLATQLAWLVNLASPMRVVDRWLSGSVLALHSVVAGSISSRGGHGIHCWCDLIMSKYLLSGFVCRVQVFAGFFGHGTSIYKSGSIVKYCVGVLGFLVIMLWYRNHSWPQSHQLMETVFAAKLLFCLQ